ncbi:helix-turn-helix domain-containing protein [Neobacillus mesonae]|uniref:helix-turn-helix domain-containing protein n=1 Tax=Neobacillus mesonae TaxID=1193713 RepID=UPI002572588F|nr:helix-turn-helix domain-containing protein [Neobacillus mesonae]
MAKRRKYSIEEKYQILMKYMEGEMTLNELLKKYKTSSFTLHSWRDKYKLYGIEGLRDSHERKEYSKELQLMAIQDYLSGNYSKLAICRKYNVSRGALDGWIMNYNNHKETRPTHRRKPLMINSRKLSFEEKVEAVHFCIKNDHNYSAVMEKYQVSYQQIYSWTKKYEAGGPESLRDRRGRKKPLDEMTEQEKLRIEIKELEAKNYRLEVENALLKKLGEIERRRY